MTKSLFAKIAGWAQFGLHAVTTVAASGAAPHGWQQWVTLIASGAVAVATHAAASTDGSN